MPSITSLRLTQLLPAPAAAAATAGPPPGMLQAMTGITFRPDPLGRMQQVDVLDAPRRLALALHLPGRRAGRYQENNPCQ